MEHWYDEEEDILGIHIKEGDYWKSLELSNGIVIDISKSGDIVGMEIFKASKIFSGDLRRVISRLLSSKNN
jgi:uncharacterized protein YuzE